MPFIPHTEADVVAMLKTIGVGTIDDLFDEIPANLQAPDLSMVPEGRPEFMVLQHMQDLASQNDALSCFAGGGAYDHAIPAAIWDVVGRGEWLTAYTPYQPEASQGSLQLIYEFQSMITGLLAMEVANAAVYDGATALVESVLMAVRSKCQQARRRILVLGSINSHYLSALNTLLAPQDIVCDSVVFDPAFGVVDPDILAEYVGEGFDALVIMQPNFFGRLEVVDALTDWAHAQDAFVIGVVNPVAMALLKPPGEWGEQGADIACGEGQPLGIPLSFGGPYLGFMACKKVLIRQMPGRIIGRTTDTEGIERFVLTLQAREQHSHRGKATSNICTGQGLLVVAATLYMSLLGPEGLRRVAIDCHQKMQQLLKMVEDIPGVSRAFSGPVFHECVLKLDGSANELVSNMARKGVLAGVPLNGYFEGAENTLLVCTTETKSAESIDHYAKLMRASMVQAVGGMV